MPADKTIAKLESMIRRRTFLAAAAGLGGLAIARSTPAQAAVVQTDFSKLPPYGNGTLPAGIRSRHIANVNGMTVHILEAGYETPGRPAVLLLHGFPELAYSWRKVMLSLAAAGYHVIAPDQRGYGRTLGWDDSYDADGDPFRILNMTRDAIGLVYALGYRPVAMVVGHDAGAPVASWSALIRPDIFRSITIMSSPFEGAPVVAVQHRQRRALCRRPAITDDELDAELAKLNPPRKYYQNYQRTRGANDDMLHAPQGLHAFFRAYYFYKSADYKGNKPHPLKARTAEEMAQIPHYYVMQKDKGMAANVAPVHAVGRLHRELQMADRSRGRGLRDRIRPHWIHRRAARLSRAARLRSQKHRRDAHFFGPHDRCSVAVHRGKKRLGRLSDARRGREDADQRLHAAWSDSIFWTAPDIGCSRSSPNR